MSTTQLGIGQIEKVMDAEVLSVARSGVFKTGGARSAAIYLKYVTGTEASVTIKVEVSADGTTYYLAPGFLPSSATLSASKNFRLMLDKLAEFWKYVKVTVTPATAGSAPGTITMLVRRGDSRQPIRKYGVGDTRPTAAASMSSPGSSVGVSGLGRNVGTSDPSSWTRSFGAAIGTHASPKTLKIATKAYTGETPARASGSADTDDFVGAPLAHIPVVPGTFSVALNEMVSGTARTAIDDGQGNIVGTGVTGTIVYATGVVTLRTTAQNVDDSTVVCAYSAVNATLDQGTVTKHGAADVVTYTEYTKGDEASMTLFGEVQIGSDWYELGTAFTYSATGNYSDTFAGLASWELAVRLGIRAPDGTPTGTAYVAARVNLDTVQHH
jgi:hypothetical protein